MSLYDYSKRRPKKRERPRRGKWYASNALACIFIVAVTPLLYVEPEPSSSRRTKRARQDHTESSTVSLMRGLRLSLNFKRKKLVHLTTYGSNLSE